MVNVRLLGPIEVREFAGELALKPSRTRGQNFVIDANTIRRIVAAAKLVEGERVLEVGPGLGSLTLGLLEAGARVTAVEIDERLARMLPRIVEQRAPELAHRLTVLCGDALEVTRLPGPEPEGFVANLPYNVAVPLLLRIFELFPSIRHGLVMVQQEVAARLCAEPGSKAYGSPSVKLAWYASVYDAGVVPAQVFWPQPRILSGLVAFERRRRPAASVTRMEVFMAIDAAFAQRRKTLRAALSAWAGGKSQAEQYLHQSDIDPRRRGETLSIADFIRLAEAKAAGAAVDGTGTEDGRDPLGQTGVKTPGVP